MRDAIPAVLGRTSSHIHPRMPPTPRGTVKIPDVGGMRKRTMGEHTVALQRAPEVRDGAQLDSTVRARI